jgi:hypothetical protein
VSALNEKVFLTSKLKSKEKLLMQKRLIAPTIACAALLCTLLAPVKAATQTTPTIKIVLPERFRVLSEQLFDLRVEATGLTNTTAQLQ